VETNASPDVGLQESQWVQATVYLHHGANLLHGMGVELLYG
jgi:hypothetical protein